jgi:hypothetical protein
MKMYGIEIKLHTILTSKLEDDALNNLKQSPHKFHRQQSLSKGCHLDVVGGPSTPHDSESDAGGSLSSWQGHPSR